MDLGWVSSWQNQHLYVADFIRLFWGLLGLLGFFATPGEEGGVDMGGVLLSEGKKT